MNIDERQAYFKDGLIYSLAGGKYDADPSLSVKKQYRGPPVKALIPNHVASQLKYSKDMKPVMEPHGSDIKNFDLFKQHYNMSLKRGSMEHSKATSVHNYP